MDRIVANTIDSVKVLELTRNGQQLACPVCGLTLHTIPENWTPELPLRGVTCPTDQKHFLIYAEDKSAAKSIRGTIGKMKG